MVKDESESVRLRIQPIEITGNTVLLLIESS